MIPVRENNGVVIIDQDIRGDISLWVNYMYITNYIVSNIRADYPNICGDPVYMYIFDCTLLVTLGPLHACHKPKSDLYIYIYIDNPYCWLVW